MKLAVVLLFLGAVAHARPQGILSDIKSIFGITDKPSSTTKDTLTTLGPAASITRSATTSSTTSTSTSLKSIPKITSSTASSTSDSSRTIATTPPTTTDTPTPTVTPQSTTQDAVPTPFSTPQSSQSSSNNGVPTAGIAVAVLMSLAVLGAIGWLLFRYNPAIRRKWLERQEKKMLERSYREAIDGPFNKHTPGPGPGSGALRMQALGGSSCGSPSISSRKSVMASFFAPRTAKLGSGREIRRKPVQWGASPEPPPPLPTAHNGSRTLHPSSAELHGGSAIEKVPLTDMAAPLGRSGSNMSANSVGANSTGGHSVVSAYSGGYSAEGQSPGGISALSPSTSIMHKDLPAVPLLTAMHQTPHLRQQPQPPYPIQEMHEMDSTPASFATNSVSSFKTHPQIPPIPHVPPLPPVPVEHGQNDGKKDVHGILTRKSIFELA